MLKSSRRRNICENVQSRTHFVANRTISEWDNEEPELIDETLSFQNFEFLSTRSDDRYISIKEGNSTNIIKKDQLIWMLENNKIHVNTDIRMIQNQNEDFWIATKDAKGDNILMFDEGNILFGKVLNFKRLHIRSKSKSTYYQDFVEIEHCDNIGVMLNPLYFIENGRRVVMDIVKFFEFKLQVSCKF